MRRLIRNIPTQHVSEIISNIIHIYVCDDVKKEYVNFASSTVLSSQDGDISDDQYYLTFSDDQLLQLSDEDILSMLAKDSNNDIIMDFDFTLRISNHLPKRFKSSQEHKNKRKQDLKEFTGGRPTRPLTKSIIVNEKGFSNYMDAYEYTDKLVDRQCFLRRSF